MRIRERVTLAARAFVLGWKILRWGIGMEKKMNSLPKPQATFAGAVASGTGIAGAITATLGLITMWFPVIQNHEPITPELLTQTTGVLTLWLTLVFARRAVAKSAPNVF